jgi:hypothetical protein
LRHAPAGAPHFDSKRFYRSAHLHQVIVISCARLPQATAIRNLRVLGI